MKKFEPLLDAAKHYVNSPDYERFIDLRSLVISDSGMLFCYTKELSHILSRCSSCPLRLDLRTAGGLTIMTCGVFAPWVSMKTSASEYEDNEALVILSVTKLIAFLEAL